MRVALGNIAQQFLRQLDIDLVAYVAQVGPVEADSEKPLDVSEIRQKIFQNDMHVIDQDKVEDLHQLISGAMPWAIPARRIVFCWEFWPVAPLPVN
nr:chorismate synthase [Lactobacillus delbrueckii]